MKKIEKIIDKVDTTSLKHSFMDACSNPDFKKYVYNLEIPEEVLIKYTSSLEDSFNEVLNCANCKNIKNCKNRVEGYRYSPIFDGKLINFSYVACHRLQKELKEKEYEKNIEAFLMPKDIKDASFKNLYKDDKNRIPIIKYFKEFMDKYSKEEVKGLYLTGSFGSGKTYLIAALFNEMAKKNIRSALVYYPEFLRNLKASFQTNYSEQFNYIKKIPLLLLDDIGAENSSAWARDEILGPILQYRMEEHLPTFFTSNLTLEELEKSLATTSSGVDKVKARRITERIKQLTTTLELVSKNRRQ